MFRWIQEIKDNRLQGIQKQIDKCGMREWEELKKLVKIKKDLIRKIKLWLPD